MAGEAQARESMGRLLTEQQRSNNSMIADAARFIAQQDATQAQLDQRGDIEGYDRYDRAHGAKRLIESQRKADAMNFLEQGVKGITDMHMWRRMMDNYDREFEADHPKSTSTNVPKIQLDPNSLFGNTNFAGTKSVLPDKLSNTSVSQQLINMFTAETPQDKVRKMKRQSIPKSWTSPTDKSFMNITGVKKQPVYAGGSEFNLFRNMTGFPNWESFMYYAPSPFKRR